MSLAAAVRMVIDGWREPAVRPDDDTMPAIGDGEWAAWARASEPIEDIAVERVAAAGPSAAVADLRGTGREVGLREPA